MDFKQGDILRVKTGSSAVGLSVYSSYNYSGSLLGLPKFEASTLITSIANDQVFGVVQSVDTVNKVALFTFSYKVYSKTGKQISHAYCDLTKCDKIDSIIANGKKYYASADVNIRNASGTLGTIRTVAKKGDYLGFSDGIADKNGFCRFQLAMGGVGYVSKKYISTSQPAREIETKVEGNKITETVENGYNSNQKIIGGIGLFLAVIGGYSYYKKKQ